jgi:Cell division protein FtsI/penicillin-binding protein 2
MKMRKIGNIAFALLFILTACAGKGGSQTSTTNANNKPTPVVQTTSIPDVPTAAKSFLDKWKSEDYAGMYALLAKTSQDALSETDFEKKYTDAASSLTLTSLDYGITSTLITPTTAKVGYAVTFNTSLFNELQKQTEMNLILENGAWKIQWDDTTILPELKSGDHLMLNITHPVRGDILDRAGNPIASNTDAVALGLDPANVSSKTISNLLAELAALTLKPVNIIQDEYNAGIESAYVPVGEVSKDSYSNYESYLTSLAGFVANEYTDRYYYNGGIAPQVVGYIQPITSDQLADYKKKGYAGDEKVGQAGLEKIEESYLAGKPTADLYVMAQDGTTVTRLFHQDPQAPDSVTTTLDKTLQIQTQKALLGFTGAAVVMEINTGKILAMASSPTFDPNQFQADNANSSYLLAEMNNGNDTSQVNRATQSSYPLGSVFKIITMSAALESGMYKPTTQYDCTSQWTELGTPFNDWTLDDGLPPSGELTLLQGLMRSCNPYFYHIALDLYRHKSGTYLADMARSFGLGEATGIGDVAEAPGAINNPTDDGSASQMGIGQGDMLVTPLQVVDFVAAVANGGTLYRPQIIQSINSQDGTALQTFAPEVRGTLPVSQSTLDAVRQGMKMVVSDPRGTAYTRLHSLEFAVYGKTGTATTSLDKPHAWFAGYTAENKTDKPDIAVVVICENAGEGAIYAAPIFRRIVESYFTGNPETQYPWEQTFYLTNTPAPTKTTPNP